MEEVAENAAAPNTNGVAVTVNGQANNSSDHSAEATSPVNTANPKKRKSVKDEKDLTVVGKRRKIPNTFLNGFSIDTKTFHGDEDSSPERPEKVEKPPKTSPAPSQSPPLKREIVVSREEADKLKMKLPKGYTYEAVVSDVASKSPNVTGPLPNKRERKKSSIVTDYVSTPTDSKSSKKESSRNSTSKSNGKRGVTKKESPTNAQATTSRISKKQIESQLLSLEQDMAAVSQKIDRKINESFEDEEMEDYQDDDPSPSNKKRSMRKLPVKKISVYDRFDSDGEEEESPKKVKQSKRIKNAQAAASTTKNTRTTNVTRATAAVAPPPASPAPSPAPSRPRGRGSRVPHEFDIPDDDLVKEPAEPEIEVAAHEPEPIAQTPTVVEPEPEPEPVDPGVMVNARRLLACHKLLLSIMRNKISNPFNQPVDPVALGIPDYVDVIKNPMDFATILEKIDSGDYESPEEFCADMRLVFSNAMLYNAPGAPVHNMAVTLSQDFERKYHKLGYAKSARPVATNSVTSPTSGAEPEPAPPQALGPLPSMKDVESSVTKAQMEQTINELKNSVKSVRDEIKKIKLERGITTTPRVTNRSAQNNKRARHPKPPPPPREDVREMTFDEKRILSNLIGTLTPDALGRVVSIINDRNPSFSSENPDNEIEIDIDALDAATLRALDKYVKSAVTKAKKKASTSKAVFAAAGAKDRVTQAEIAAQNTTKSIQDVEKRLKEYTRNLKKKKGKKGEEDKDKETNEDVIIDDDTPNKEYPSVVIEKDNASSSTSSSSSESSSTDSESSSDSDAEKKKKEQPSTKESTTSTNVSSSTTTEKPEQDAKDSTLPVPTSPKSTEPSTTSENSKKDSDVKMEDSSNTSSSNPTTASNAATVTAPVDAPKIITPSASIVNKEIELKNLDSWNLSSMEETTNTTEPQQPPAKDDMWSKFQSRDLQNKQREKEREEQEEKEKREKAERETERRRQEEERKRLEQEEIEKKRQAEEEEKLAFEREIAQKRAAEKAAREQGSSSRNLLDQSLVMSSFEQQGRYDKPPILDMFRMKDNEHKEEAEF